MGKLEGRIGVTYPTFEEYPNRLVAERIVRYHPANVDFRYSADDLIEYFSANPVESLLIVNPDNPSGNFIDRRGLKGWQHGRKRKA